MTILPLIAIVFMAITILAKWFASSSLTNFRMQLAEAMDQGSQAKFRLKAAVSEVTTTNAEMDKMKRRIKSTERKIERFQKEYQDFTTKARQDAEMNAEKLRLAKELQRRKGG